MKKSRTQQALDWLAKNPKETRHAAALRFKLTPNAVYASLKRREGKKLCPCCGQVIRQAASH